MERETAKYDAIENIQGKMSAFSITNPATIRYLQRVGRQGEIVTVDVGRIPQREYFRRASRSQQRGQRAIIWRDSGSDLGWFSHVLYLASPVLTVTAIVFLALLRECKRSAIHVEGSSLIHPVQGMGSRSWWP